MRLKDRLSADISHFYPNKNLGSLLMLEETMRELEGLLGKIMK